MTFTVGVSENQRIYSVNLFGAVLHNFTGASYAVWPCRQD